jgi:hypothetical protein
VDARNSHARLVYNQPACPKPTTCSPFTFGREQGQSPPRSRPRLHNGPAARSRPPIAQQAVHDCVPKNNHPTAWPLPRSLPPLPTRSAGTHPSTARSESPFTQAAGRGRLVQPTPPPSPQPPLQAPPQSQRTPRSAAKAHAHASTWSTFRVLPPWLASTHLLLCSRRTSSAHHECLVADI